MAWNEERVELLKKLWSEGLSASQIASKMGGVTRNAVIGKVHRLGLSGRATPAKPQRGRSYHEPAEPQEPSAYSTPSAPATPAMPEPAFTAPLSLEIDDKTTVTTLSKNMCRWPMGDPSTDDFHFCGQPTSPGKSYCTYHARLAFQPTQRKAEPRREPKKLPASAQPRRAAG